MGVYGPVEVAEKVLKVFAIMMYLFYDFDFDW
jgi:hypothetical protein